MKCSLGISNFLEEISRLSHSVVFLYFFALITEKGFLIFKLSKKKRLLCFVSTVLIRNSCLHPCHSSKGTKYLGQSQKWRGWCGGLGWRPVPGDCLSLPLLHSSPWLTRPPGQRGSSRRMARRRRLRQCPRPRPPMRRPPLGRGSRQEPSPPPPRLCLSTRAGPTWTLVSLSVPGGRSLRGSGGPV